MIIIMINGEGDRDSGWEKEDEKEEKDSDSDVRSGLSGLSYIAHTILIALLLSEALNRELSKKVIPLSHNKTYPIPPAFFVSQPF